MPVFLNGMMGSGKSTVGRLLADRLGATFIDHDERVERIAGRSVAAMFEEGEAVFRRWERASLEDLVNAPGFSGSACVVAMGGGTLVDGEALARACAVGTVVYLQVPVDTLVRRLRTRPGDRPLLEDAPSLRARLEGLLDVRGASYEASDVVVDGTGEPGDVADAIAARLQAS